jgi:hypothetical protein
MIRAPALRLMHTKMLRRKYEKCGTRHRRACLIGMWLRIARRKLW